jgi:hypothetical protein
MSILILISTVILMKNKALQTLPSDKLIAEHLSDFSAAVVIIP